MMLGGCGGDDDGDRPDARPAIDATPLADANNRGNVGDFFDNGGTPCVENDDCQNAASDCVAIGRLNGSPKQCVPRCTTRDDCPYGYSCYLSDESQLGIAVMKDHCWLSLCGPDQFGNGVTGGACQVGGDLGPTQPAAEVFPGWCSSLVDGSYGICNETGSVAQGGTCDFVTQTHAGNNCDPTSLCIGQSGQPTGTCKQWCDPAQVVTGTPTTCTTAGEECLDRSAIATFSDGSTNRRSVAWCDAIIACKTVGPNLCPVDGTGLAQACGFSNSLHATGSCSIDATGAIAVGGNCPDMPAGDAEECVAGSVCFGMTGMRKCTTLCDIGPTPVVTCPGATTCQGILWDGGFDGTTGTPDDNYTTDWGLCQ